MSYITTFDAAFWTSIVLAAAVYCYQYFCSDHCVRLVHGLVKRYGLIKLSVAYAVVTIAAAIGWFMWSVKGTSTAMFWATVFTIVLYPLVRKFYITVMERNIASFEKIGL